MSYYFDAWQEHCDYEANAAYDYIHEAYCETARDCDEMARQDAEIELREFYVEVQDDIEARGATAFRFGRPFIDDYCPF